jgi:hypothetical protein
LIPVPPDVMRACAEHNLDPHVGAITDTDVWVPAGDDFAVAATLRAIVMPCNDTAEPWCPALAILDDAFHGDAPVAELESFATLDPHAVSEARRRIRASAGPLIVPGLGCYLQTVAALTLPATLSAPSSAVSRLSALSPDERGRYRYEIVADAIWRLDLRPMVRDAVFELIGGERSSRIAARVLNTIGAALADVLRGTARATGRVPIILAAESVRQSRLAALLTANLGADFQIIVPRNGTSE